MYFPQSAPTVLHPANGCASGRPAASAQSRATNARRTSVGSKGALAPLLQLIRDPTGSIANVVKGIRDVPCSGKQTGHLSPEARKQLLYFQLRSALTSEDWQLAAEELDRLEGNDDWKAERDSQDYDAGIVQARLKQLDDARISCDLGRMLFLIRTSLTRGLGGMGNIKLYNHSHVGTKHLIETYINSALETLEAVLNLSAQGAPTSLDPRYILEQVILARQSFGRSALLLSGGATFGMNHIGVLRALWEARLLPRIISGASAGSIVCAALCVSTDEEIPQLLEEFPHGDLAVFEREGEDDGVLKKVARFLKSGAWIDISHLIRVLKRLLGDITFQEAYNRTRRILNICVSSASVYELPRLLNYVTAPNVLIWSAVAASCSVPFVFSSTSLLAKDPKTGEAVPWNPSPQRWIDGSVDNDLPMTRLAEMFNVNHFIVSQVNPHVVPFLAKEEHVIAAEAQSGASGPGWLHSFTKLAKSEALHRMQVLAELGIFPNTLTKARSVLSQKYSGDITIFPEISYADFPRMLSNPNSDFILQAMVCGQRATWPKLSHVRNHCAIELALDDAVQQLRTRVVFSPSQVDLRLNTVKGIPHGTSVPSTGPPRSKNKDTHKVVRRARSTGLNEENAVAIKNVLSKQSPRRMRSKSTTNNSHNHIFDLSSDSSRPPDNEALRARGSFRRTRAARPASLKFSHLSPFATATRNPLPAGNSDADEEGEGTSNSIHSSSSIPQSSSSSCTSTPTSPSHFPGPTSTASNMLFPFASQPNTPQGARPLSSSSGTSMGTNKLSLAMTPGSSQQAEPPSSAEQTYKRLFHDQQQEPLDRASEKNLTGRAMGKAVEDLSGTRGMVMRRRKSEKNLVMMKK
ncbi:MAG: hypothetical protein M1837_005992 [Sclerophora amabilis]|nr:MAG: hypothetical protein M1837_005992 [Sclerophora amabilis]